MIEKRKTGIRGKAAKGQRETYDGIERAATNPLWVGQAEKATATELNIDPNLLLKATRAIKLLKESFPARIMLIGRDEVLRKD